MNIHESSLGLVTLQNDILFPLETALDRSDYSRIQINRGKQFSPISQSILNQFSCNFTHTIFHSCRDYSR